MKKLITLLALSFMLSCSNDDEPQFDGCKTVTNKESAFEYVGNGDYKTVYYLYLDGTKTKVSKKDFDKYNVGSEKCLDY